MGASLNAFTSREQTVYYSTSRQQHSPLSIHVLPKSCPLSFENILIIVVKCFEKDKERAVEFLSDVLLNSKMEDDWVSNERNVILLEMKVHFAKSKHLAVLLFCPPLTASTSTTCRMSWCLITFIAWRTAAVLLASPF